MNFTNREEVFDKFTIGPWAIYPESGILSNGTGDEVYLELRLAKLFYLLVKNSNELVSRKHLIEQLWDDTIVNEESLTKAISDLRKVLKTHFDYPPQIKTIPKRGYKIILTKQESREALWKVVLKYSIYFLLVFTIIILVIRGLNY